MKKKISDDQKKALKDFLETNVRGIINAELDTYKETAVSTHSSRVYIFTTYSMGIADIELYPGDGIDSVIKDIVDNFKINEKAKLQEQEEAYAHYMAMGGSYISALLCFLPSSALNIKLDKLDTLPEDLKEKAITLRIKPSDILENKEYCEKYKHLVEDVLAVHYVSFYTQRGRLYRVIQHNDEVLDLPVYTQYGFGDKNDVEAGQNSRTAKLINLIELE